MWVEGEGEKQSCLCRGPVGVLDALSLQMLRYSLKFKEYLSSYGQVMS